MNRFDIILKKPVPVPARVQKKKFQYYIGMDLGYKHPTDIILGHVEKEAFIVDRSFTKVVTSRVQLINEIKHILEITELNFDYRYLKGKTSYEPNFLNVWENLPFNCRQANTTRSWRDEIIHSLAWFNFPGKDYYLKDNFKEAYLLAVSLFFDDLNADRVKGKTDLYEISL